MNRDQSFLITAYCGVLLLIIEIVLGIAFRFPPTLLLATALHLAFCVLAIAYLRYSSPHPHHTLHLTQDEAYILDELSRGKQQKEIARWNKNTVSKKLKQARERNHVLSNAELLLIYRQQQGAFLGNAD